MRNIIPVQELIRNKRVQELMNKKKQQSEKVPEKLTEEQKEEVKKYVKQGIKRDEAVRIVLSMKNLKSESSPIIKDWNKGGFINDEKYKQPIKHRK